MRAMKDSGVEWIGEIPEGWEIGKIAAFARFYNGDRSSKYPSAEELMDDGVPFINSTNIERDQVDITTCKYISVEKYNSLGGAKIEINDIIFCLRGSTGKAAKNTKLLMGTVASSLMVIRAQNIFHQYLYYCLVSPCINEQVELSMNGTCAANLSATSVGRFVFAYPNIPSQISIAAFLDAKCAQIDAIIEKQQQVIEKLKAYKQSVITEAVTKGLDPTVPKKDCGVKWIGMVPEHWEFTRLRFLIELIESGVSVNAGQDAFDEDEIRVLKTSCVSKYEFDVCESKSVNNEEIPRVQCPVKSNTIIISRMNTPELVGACGYVSKSYANVFLPDRLWQVHFKDDVIVKYLWYCLVSKNTRGYYESLSTGTSSSMQNISQSQLGNVTVALPSKFEQQNIVDYLDFECGMINSSINRRQSLVAKLFEYRKSLIYEVVTGKMEV